MSSYVTPEECYEYYDQMFRVKRHPDILFTTGDPKVIARLQKQFSKGEALHVNIQGWAGKAFVLRLEYREPFARHLECNAVLRPTGRPTSHSDALRVGDTVRVKKPTGFLERVLQEEGLKMLREATKLAPKDTGALRNSYVTGPECDVYFNENAFKLAMAPLTAKEKPVKIRNKYYVAADRVTTHSEQDQDNVDGKVAFAGVTSQSRSYGKWTRKDLSAAIAHAEQVLEADPAKEHVAIVKIIRVVRRKKAPLVVEVIK
jgi:hypothetical protein